MNHRVSNSSRAHHDTLYCPNFSTSESHCILHVTELCQHIILFRICSSVPDSESIKWQCLAMIADTIYYLCSTVCTFACYPLNFQTFSCSISVSHGVIWIGKPAHSYHEGFIRFISHSNQMGESFFFFRRAECNR